MKTAKKLFASLLVVVMALALAVPAWASASGTGSITISNAVPGEKYTLYKVFDLSYDGDGKNESDESNSPYQGVSYTYTKTDESDAFYTALSDNDDSPFTLTETGTDVYQVTLIDGKGESDVVSFLKENITDAQKSGEPKTASAAAEGATTSEVKFENLAYGYYYITSSLGSVVTVDSTIPDVVVTEKNEVPSLTKEVVDENGNTVENPSASVGKTINFKITLTIPDTADKKIVVHDKMGAGLTLVTDSISIKVSNNAVTDTNYTLTTTGLTDGCTFEIEFNDTYVTTLTAETAVTITYSAKVNAQAADGESANNTAWLTYSEQDPTPPDPVDVPTYSFDLIKTGPATEANGTSYPVLSGAKFKLYDAETDGNEISLTKVADGDYYRPALDGDTSIEYIEAGEVTIKGLAAGTYYLEEIEAPDGYNKLTDRTKVEITNANLINTKATDGTYTRGENDTGIQIQNNKGAELPSTGGIGTTIFYVIGGVLVVAAIVLLVTRKRMNNAD